MQRIECWRLESVNEPTNTLTARFRTKEAAEDAKSTAGGYGPVIRPETIIIFESAIEFSPERFDTETKAAALAKLSDREKLALGLRIEPEA